MSEQGRRIPRTTRAGALRGLWLGFLPLVLALPGCANKHGQMVEFLRAHEAEVATGQYVVKPPDELTFHSPNVPEIDGMSEAVGPDGKVALRLLGDVDVAGLTTEEIAAKLKAQLTRYYVEPEVVVEVTAHRSQFFYVFGEVANPGPRLFTGRDTLLRALAEAQPTYLAWRAQVRVTRPAAKAGAARTMIVDLDHILATGDASQDVLLEAGDVIEVPPTPLAWVGHRVRELMYPVSPVLNAYTAPAGVIGATRTYREGVDVDYDEDDDRPRWRR